MRKVLLYRSVCKPRSAISYECFSKFAFTPLSVQPLGFQRTHHVNRDASITKTMHLDRMINSWGYKFRIYICQILTLHVSLSSEFLLPGVRRGLLLARIEGESWIWAHIFLKTVQMGYTSTLNTLLDEIVGLISCGIFLMGPTKIGSDVISIKIDVHLRFPHALNHGRYEKSHFSCAEKDISLCPPHPLPPR